MDISPRRVAILSPQDVVVRGLTSMLAEDPARATVVADVEGPDLVLYDVISLHHGDGTDLDRVLLLDDDVTVLAVAHELRPDLLAQALARGAHGFVPLDIPAESLLRAVSTAHHAEDGASGPWLPQDVDVEQHRRGHGVGLTAREQEVLGLIAQGHSNVEIARRCFLSINSVKTYIRTAYRKIGATSRSQAVIWALTHGFAATHDRPAAPGRDPALTRAV